MPKKIKVSIVKTKPVRIVNRKGTIFVSVDCKKRSAKADKKF